MVETTKRKYTQFITTCGRILLPFFSLVDTNPSTPPHIPYITILIYLCFHFIPPSHPLLLSSPGLFLPGFQPGESAQQESDAKAQLEGHVVLDRRPEIDSFDVSLDPSRGYDVVALGSRKLFEHFEKRVSGSEIYGNQLSGWGGSSGGKMEFLIFSIFSNSYLYAQYQHPKNQRQCPGEGTHRHASQQP